MPFFWKLAASLPSEHLDRGCGTRRKVRPPVGVPEAPILGKVRRQVRRRRHRWNRSREVSDVLVSIEGERSVVGVHDATWGEIPVAFIRPIGAPPSEQELFTFCRQHLAPYKTPRHWRFVDRFPQTASGKVQKFALRDAFQPDDGSVANTAS